jgi:hypothetical protein
MTTPYSISQAIKDSAHSGAPIRLYLDQSNVEKELETLNIQFDSDNDSVYGWDEWGDFWRLVCKGKLPEKI